MGTSGYEDGLEQFAPHASLGTEAAMGDTGSIHAISGIQRERDACHVGGAPLAGDRERLRVRAKSWPNDVETRTERMLGEPS